MNNNQINQTILNSIIHDNQSFVNESGQSVKEYHMLDFEATPEGWDCVFNSDESWDMISNEDREQRKSNLEKALEQF